MRSTLRPLVLTSLATLMLSTACSPPPVSFADAGRMDAAPTDATDGNADTNRDAQTTCARGVDTDRDGLDDDQECALGTDPNDPDSDDDGLSDGVEAHYGQICIGTSVPQRRPPVACATNDDCMAGETCRGLDPRSADTDRDGVTDRVEDTNGDGVIDPALGETDPRLWDTDGDGHADSTADASICRTDGLAQVTVVTLPNAQSQLAHDPVWGSAASVGGTVGRGGVTLDDPTAHVAGFVFSRRADSGDVRSEASAIEATLVSALPAGTTPVLVGRALTTHDLRPAVWSTYRIVASGAEASELRDRLVMPAVGSAAPAHSVSAGRADEFLMDVTTILRAPSGGMQTVASVAIAPRADLEDPTHAASIRVSDLTNTTPIANSDAALDAVCQSFTASQTPPVDFLWTVDTSGSMDDDQARVGQVAEAFFASLRAANISFRVGVFQAGAGRVNLEAGFHWIDGNDPMGGVKMCEQVTHGMCPLSSTDASQPFPLTLTGPGQASDETPVGAAVTVHYAFASRTRAGETNPELRLSGGRVVAFFITDEPTTDTYADANDWQYYFHGGIDPQGGLPWGGANFNATTLQNIVSYFRRNEILTFGLVPRYSRSCAAADSRDLPRCVIEANGGAVLPIGTASDAEVAAAFARIVDAVAGSSSQYVLTRTPITSTIKVRVRGQDVPRSRVDGFDYDPASHAIIFYGTTYRPANGDRVTVSYRAWGGSIG